MTEVRLSMARPGIWAKRKIESSNNSNTQSEFSHLTFYLSRFRQINPIRARINLASDVKQSLPIKLLVAQFIKFWLINALRFSSVRFGSHMPSFMP